MISPISPLGILLNWICLTATVSPVAQLSAPTRTHESNVLQILGICKHTIDLSECSFAKGIAKLLDHEHWISYAL